MIQQDRTDLCKVSNRYIKGALRNIFTNKKVLDARRVLGVRNSSLQELKLLLDVL